MPGEIPYLGVGGTHRIAWGDGVSGEMTKSEYQELVEFIAPRFDDMNKRFDAIDDRFVLMDKRFDAIDERFVLVDKRFDAIDERFVLVDKRFDAIDERFVLVDKRFDAIDERLRRGEILGEENRHQIRILAEAVSDTVSKATFEAFRSEVAVGFDGLRELLQASHLDLDRRVTRLEEGRTG